MRATIFEKCEMHDEIIYLASIDEPEFSQIPVKDCVFFSAAKYVPFNKGDKIRMINLRWYLVSFIKVLIEKDVVITNRNDAVEIFFRRKREG